MRFRSFGQSGPSPANDARLAASPCDRFTGAGPVALNPFTAEAGVRKVCCLSRAASAPGRPWASNLRGALWVDDACPTVPNTSICCRRNRPHQRYHSCRFGQVGSTRALTSSEGIDKDPPMLSAQDAEAHAVRSSRLQALALVSSSIRSAAFACRASRQITGRRIPRRLCVSQFDIRPVSRPTRTSAEACLRNASRIAFGVEAHMSRQTTAPSASRTQLEVEPSETSRPA